MSADLLMFLAIRLRHIHDFSLITRIVDLGTIGSDGMSSNPIITLVDILCRPYVARDKDVNN